MTMPVVVVDNWPWGGHDHASPMAGGGPKTCWRQAEVAVALRVENILKIEEKSLKNNSVKAKTNVDGSDLVMLHDLNTRQLVSLAGYTQT